MPEGLVFDSEFAHEAWGDDHDGEGREVMNLAMDRDMADRLRVAKREMNLLIECDADPSELERVQDDIDYLEERLGR